MNIFLSFKSPEDTGVVEAARKRLRASGHNAYPKDLLGFFGPRGLYDPDALDEHLRDEDLSLVFLSKASAADSWLRGELHALLTLEHKFKSEYKFRRQFVLPVLLDTITTDDIPDECLQRPYLDFRGKPHDENFEHMLKQIKVIASEPRLAVFISHSNKDDRIAEALAGLFIAAFELGKGEILCTSVEGHRLPIGARHDETIRRKIREAQVFVCVATKHSFGDANTPGSFYGTIELGARWGIKRFLVFLLARGAKGDLLKAPFGSFHALSCDDNGQVQQFLDEIAQPLGRSGPKECSDAIDELVRASISGLEEDSVAPSTS